MNYATQKGGAWLYCETAEALPEANIQAEFYHCCRLLGINCLLEFKTCAGRHDALILNERADSIVAIVECKAGKVLDPGGRQVINYSRLGLPIFPLNRMLDAMPLAEKIRASIFHKSLSLADSLTLFKRERKPRRPKAFSARDIDECMNLRD